MSSGAWSSLLLGLDASGAWDPAHQSPDELAVEVGRGRGEAGLRLEDLVTSPGGPHGGQGCAPAPGGDLHQTQHSNTQLWHSTSEWVLNSSENSEWIAHRMHKKYKVFSSEFYWR